VSHSDIVNFKKWSREHPTTPVTVGNSLDASPQSPGLPSSKPPEKSIVQNIKPAKTGPRGVLMLSDLNGVEEQENEMSEADTLSIFLVKAELSMPQSGIPSPKAPGIGDSYSNKLSVSDSSPGSRHDRQHKGNSQKLSHSIKSLKIHLTQSHNECSPKDPENTMQFNYNQRISKAGAKLGKSRNRLQHVGHILDPEDPPVSLSPKYEASKFGPGRKPSSDNSIGRQDFRKKTSPKNLDPPPLQFRRTNSSDTVNNQISLGQVMTPVNAPQINNVQTLEINRRSRFNSCSGGTEQQSL
jgi:hypothetical protein